MQLVRTKVRHLAVMKHVQSVTARSAGNAIEKVKLEHQYGLFISPSSYTDKVPGRSTDCVRSCKTIRLPSSQKACDCSKLLELAVEGAHSTAHVVS